MVEKMFSKGTVTHLCCVQGCKYQELSKVIGIPRHSFPANDDIRKLWIRAVGNPSLTESMHISEFKKYRVCGKHFKPSDYELDTKFILAPHLFKEKKMLKKTVVPTIFFTADPQPPTNVKDNGLGYASKSSVDSKTLSSERKPESTVNSGALCSQNRLSTSSSELSSSDSTDSDTGNDSVPEKRTLSSGKIQKRKSESIVKGGALCSHSTSVKLRRSEEIASSPSTSTSKEFFSQDGLPTASSRLSSSDCTDSDTGNAVLKKRFMEDIMQYMNHELFKRCLDCGENIPEFSTKRKGAQVCISWECENGHCGKWSSCR